MPQQRHRRRRNGRPVPYGFTTGWCDVLRIARSVETPSVIACGDATSLAAKRPPFVCPADISPATRGNLPSRERLTGVVRNNDNPSVG